jgi:hypothetical protein
MPCQTSFHIHEFFHISSVIEGSHFHCQGVSLPLGKQGWFFRSSSASIFGYPKRSGFARHRRCFLSHLFWVEPSLSTLRCQRVRPFTRWHLPLSPHIDQIPLYYYSTLLHLPRQGWRTPVAILSPSISHRSLSFLLFVLHLDFFFLFLCLAIFCFCSSA